MHHHAHLLVSAGLAHAEIASVCFEAPIASVHLRHMSTNVWPLQHHHREALGAALKWEGTRVGFRPSQLSSTPRSCTTARQDGYALIDAASETIADAIAKVCRVLNVSDLAVAPTCAISRSLPRMAAHEADPDLSRVSGQVAVSGGTGSARFHAHRMNPHLVPVDLNKNSREGCAQTLLVFCEEWQ